MGGRVTGREVLNGLLAGASKEVKLFLSEELHFENKKLI